MDAAAVYEAVSYETVRMRTGRIFLILATQSFTDTSKIDHDNTTKTFSYPFPLPRILRPSFLPNHDVSIRLTLPQARAALGRT